jgi:hypothetical protein
MTAMPDPIPAALLGRAKPYSAEWHTALEQALGPAACRQLGI